MLLWLRMSFWGGFSLLTSFARQVFAYSGPLTRSK
jgi:hypothetical protein